MSNNKFYLLGVSALMSAGLLTSVPAQAGQLRLGSVNLQIDTTVSLGGSWLTADRETAYLPTANGGPAETAVYISPTGENCAGEAAFTYGKFCQDLPHNVADTKPNFDGSINTDDGRLNFDNGDAFAAPLKITAEFEAEMGDFTAFVRASAYHDIVTSNEDSFARGGELVEDADGSEDSGEENIAQRIELLDAFISYDSEIGGLPLTVKAGRQVINWGEATFIPGGNSAFSPIDVAALRRPGAEIKEALLPVEAFYVSLGLPYNLSVEAYVGGWDSYRLDAGGTAFGGSDSFTDGTASGNPQNHYFIGGSGKGGRQFACNFGALAAAGLAASAGVSRAIQATGAVDCANNPNMDVTKQWTVGNAEAERVASGDYSDVTGITAERAKEILGEDPTTGEDFVTGDGEDSMGLAVRWYSDTLGSTDFALYYQKGDSRLPYISYLTEKSDLTVASTGARASTVARGVGIAGCLGLLGPTKEATGTALLYNPLYAATTINDQYNLLGNPVLNGVANQVAAALAPAGYTGRTAGGKTVAAFQELQCLLAIGQRNAAVTLGSDFDPTGQLPTGATNLVVDYNLSLFPEYPEVETMGFSFNTTVLGWGVQGDFSFRPEVPLQLDTDTLTIASLFNSCAFTAVGGVEGIYLSGSTVANEFGTIGCSDQTKYLQGYTTDYDATTWDIGTTSTFTRSNWLIGLLGSDLGVLLLEFQGVMVDGIEEERGNTGGITALGGAKGITPLTNVCSSGSDLPLNGILSIDDRALDNEKGYCRPTDNSSGMVLLFQLRYNNVFGTPVGLRPTLVHSQGLQGYSPSPIGFWREGVSSTALSLTAQYLASTEVSLSYRTYGGDLDRTRNLDRDNVSLSVSYAF